MLPERHGCQVGNTLQAARIEMHLRGNINLQQSRFLCAEPSVTANRLAPELAELKLC